MYVGISFGGAFETDWTQVLEEGGGVELNTMFFPQYAWIFNISAFCGGVLNPLPTPLEHNQFEIKYWPLFKLLF